MSSQRFCLRWNNHQSNLLSVFDQLLHDEAFVDVTLAVEGQFLRAHKMVLSACSPYFQALFVGHPDKHPIVILKDVPFSDMKSLLDFMYRGEVSVDQDRLTAFLKVAESLRIKGLTEVNEERCDLPSIANSLLNQALPPPPPPPPPPSLHRLPPVKRHPPPPTINPMLNSALTAPKRKRGRPRKLSGSNPGQPPSALLQDSMDQDEKHQPHLPSPLMENHLGSIPSSMQQQIQAHQQRLQQAQQQHHIHQLQQHHHHLQVPPHPALPPQLPGSQGENVTLRRCLSPGGRGGGSASPRDEEESSMKQEEEEEDEEGMMDGEMSENMKVEAEEDGAPEEEEGQGHQDEDQRSPEEARKDQPKPSTSGQESSYQNNTHTDGERFSTSEECLGSVTVSICEDVSLTPFPRGELPPEDGGVEISAEDVTLNPVQFASHFLSHEAAILHVKEESPEDTEDELTEGGGTPPRRRDLLEYLMNEDGSVVCKRCGELLPSRTQWYRHKYKFHIESPPAAALFKCFRCNVFFKSRKGYLGHLSTRHSRVEERLVPSSTCRRGRRSSEEAQSNPEEYEKQREKEEKLVADIIDRVKRECEAQGSTVTRKGYSRRSTIMNT